MVGSSNTIGVKTKFKKEKKSITIWGVLLQSCIQRIRGIFYSHDLDNMIFLSVNVLEISCLKLLPVKMSIIEPYFLDGKVTHRLTWRTENLRQVNNKLACKYGIS